MWFIIVTVTPAVNLDPDVHPQTWRAKFFVACTIVLGVLFLAMPLSTVGQNFNQVWNERHTVKLQRLVRQLLLENDKRLDDTASHRLVFNQVDRSLNGKISPDEFFVFVTHTLSMRLSRREFNKLWRVLDENRVGEIGFNRFSEFVFPDYLILNAEDDDSSKSVARQDSTPSPLMGRRDDSSPVERRPSFALVADPSFAEAGTPCVRPPQRPRLASFSCGQATAGLATAAIDPTEALCYRLEVLFNASQEGTRKAIESLTARVDGMSAQLASLQALHQSDSQSMRIRRVLTLDGTPAAHAVSGPRQKLRRTNTSASLSRTQLGTTPEHGPAARALEPREHREADGFEDGPSSTGLRSCISKDTPSSLTASKEAPPLCAISCTRASAPADASASAACTTQGGDTSAGATLAKRVKVSDSVTQAAGAAGITHAPQSATSNGDVARPTEQQSALKGVTEAAVLQAGGLQA